jgi:hypothetical protein
VNTEVTFRMAAVIAFAALSLVLIGIFAYGIRRALGGSGIASFAFGIGTAGSLAVAAPLGSWLAFAAGIVLSHAISAGIGKWFGKEKP